MEQRQAIVERSYRDARGRERHISPRARQAVVAAMGDAEATGTEAVAIVRPGGRLPVAGEVVLEDGTSLGRLDALPRDVPFGYHRFMAGDRESLLITGPGRCVLPPARAWGWTAQLYATRSAASWGIGDLGDLRTLCAWAAGLGAGFVATNPLHAGAPGIPQQPSPYFPSSRRFRNPLYLRVEDVAGAATLHADVERLGRAGRALNHAPRIARDAIFELKRRALERIWEARPPLHGFETYRAEQGAPLRQWATYAAIAELHGPRWSGWPPGLRRPDAPAVDAFAAQHRDRVDFHAWLQWQLDEQLARAGEALPVIGDLAIGIDRHGADAWAWQDELGLGANIGAPPDAFNPAGQDWGLPPFVPDRLRAVGYRPFIETLRAALRHAGGLRIDHVIGLFRQWWVPLGADPEDGAYVRYPTDELLEIVALESVRATVPIIGEDLGTVAPGVRRDLRRRRILSCRLAYFERVPPARYPRGSLAAVTTHDLPTLAGLWLGTDLDAQRRAGLLPDMAGLARVRERIRRIAGVAPDADLDEVVLRLHAALAASPSLLVSATLEDALRVEERPNMPGTLNEHPNWSIPLPVSIEQLRSSAQVRELATVLSTASNGSRRSSRRDSRPRKRTPH
jgi:4-alpha-glucanotransferase